MSELSQFTYDNIPALPEEQPAPLSNTLPMTQPTDPMANPAMNGIPMFELIAKKLPNGSFVNIEYMHVLTPGDPKAKPYHKVEDFHRQKYALYYQAWKRGLEMAPVGTPLEMWPVPTPAQIRELKAINIFTVEQLRDVADVNLHRIPLGVVMRQQAQKWLELKVNADVVARQVDENNALRDSLNQQAEQLANQQAEMAELRRQMQAMTAAMATPKVEETDAVPVPENAPMHSRRTR